MTTRKIYIDSRQAIGTGSDFRVTVKQSVQVPENTVAYIDDVILPDTFLTVDANRGYVYVSETYGGATLSFRIQIPLWELLWGWLGGGTAGRAETTLSNSGWQLCGDLRCEYWIIQNHQRRDWELVTGQSVPTSLCWSLGRRQLRTKPSGCV